MGGGPQARVTLQTQLHPYKMNTMSVMDPETSATASG